MAAGIGIGVAIGVGVAVGVGVGVGVGAGLGVGDGVGVGMGAVHATNSRMEMATTAIWGTSNLFIIMLPSPLHPFRLTSPSQPTDPFE